MRKTHRPLAAATLAIAALAPAAAAQAATRTADLGYGGKPPKGTPEAAAAFEFFPNRLKINAGDTVKYRVNGFGIVYSGPKKKIQPLATADAANLISGAVDPLGNPFWFENEPNVGVNPMYLAPAGDGKVHKGQKDVDHGALEFGPPKPYALTFSKPGSYKVYDALHPKVFQTVVVVPKGKKVPGAAADKIRSAKQLATLVKQAKQLEKVKPGANEILVGHDSKRIGFFQFFAPKTITAGQPVTIKTGPTVNDVHNIAIGPDEYMHKASADGELFQPAADFSSVTLAPQTIYSSQKGAATFDGTQNGGFYNSGALDADKRTPLPDTATVTFTKPGTYHLVCLFHSDGVHGMETTITVK